MPNCFVYPTRMDSFHQRLHQRTRRNMVKMLYFRSRYHAVLLALVKIVCSQSSALPTCLSTSPNQYCVTAQNILQKCSALTAKSDIIACYCTQTSLTALYGYVINSNWPPTGHQPSFLIYIRLSPPSPPSALITDMPARIAAKASTRNAVSAPNSTRTSTPPSQIGTKHATHHSPASPPPSQSRTLPSSPPHLRHATQCAGLPGRRRCVQQPRQRHPSVRDADGGRRHHVLRVCCRAAGFGLFVLLWRGQLCEYARREQ